LLINIGHSVLVKGTHLKLKYFLILFLAIVLPACQDTTSTIPTSTEAKTAIEATAGQVARAWSISAYDKPEDPAQTTESGLRYIMLEEGSGRTPQTGELVEVHYTGKLADGTQFDSSYDRGKPLRFTLGTGEVIPGWDEGVRLLKEGGQAILIVPPELAYGGRGSG
jgi:peptidylprolyl isomerase